MLLLLAVYYLPRRGVQALPIPTADASVSPSPQSCDDLRTIWDIIWSCLITIFASSWAAIHPNIPSPEDTRLRIFLRRAGITMMSLVAPELLVIWALRQRLAARRLADKYKDLSTICSPFPERKSLTLDRGTDPAVTATTVNHETDAKLNDSRIVHSPSPDTSQLGFLSQDKKIESSRSVSSEDQQPDSGWTITHGFFGIMGGFMLYDGDTPLRTLDPDKFEYFVKIAKIIQFPRITKKEIQDMSTGDLLSKGLVLVQTGWFVLQFLARAVAHLPITKLEIFTLAFVLLNTITYVLWWDKPQNVNSAHRVQRISHEVESEELFKDSPLWQLARNQVFTLRMIDETLGQFAYMGGLEKDIAPGAKRVPTFYAAEDDMDIIGILVFSGVAVAMAFGALHCIAWSFQFPSHKEELLWRVFSLATLCAPLVFWASTALCRFAGNIPAMEIFIATIGVIAFVLASLLYIVSRIGLVILVFASLRSLPSGAYQTVSWTTFIPHI